MKKSNMIFAAVLVGVFVLVICVCTSSAVKDKLLPPPRIAVVSVKELFDNCNFKTDTEKELAAEGDKRYSDIKKLAADIDADKNAMTKIKEDSPEYMTSLKSVMLKQAQYDAEKEFYQQDLTQKEMRGKERIYRKILEAIAQVAQEKGFNMILNRDDNYLSMPDSGPPAQNPTDLILTTKTHKLLYYDKDYDVTQDVLMVLNSQTPKAK